MWMVKQLDVRMTRQRLDKVADAVILVVIRYCCRRFLVFSNCNQANKTKTIRQTHQPIAAFVPLANHTASL
jgi:DNA-directed RNA polymerase subunit N (RpoN/RPB10)